MSVNGGFRESMVCSLDLQAFSFRIKEVGMSTFTAEEIGRLRSATPAPRTAQAFGVVGGAGTHGIGSRAQGPYDSGHRVVHSW